MRFRQLDKITELVPGERIVAVRHVREGEDYLRDHFPLFPVMPGVLMLEALFQASCWLVRVSENFESSLLVLKEARNVKFADFMEPGQTLQITAEILKSEPNSVTIKATGTKGEVVAVSARLIIGKSNLETSDIELSPLDEFMRESMRLQLNQLTD
ncbi:MAG: beta-hydroxyacyl-ACP dehydratase [Planctomycetota bacterium]|jgi:3-hydroxyacyl-[acyl-carrier-protein] dehydratase|nr:beta-hydroxyacyl-ACP dehydratase [Planctomycetota bacterium]